MASQLIIYVVSKVWKKKSCTLTASAICFLSSSVLAIICREEKKVIKDRCTYFQPAFLRGQVFQYRLVLQTLLKVQSQPKINLRNNSKKWPVLRIVSRLLRSPPFSIRWLTSIRNGCEWNGDIFRWVTARNYFWPPLSGLPSLCWYF